MPCRACSAAGDPPAGLSQARAEAEWQKEAEASRPAADGEKAEDWGPHGETRGPRQQDKYYAPPNTRGNTLQKIDTAPRHPRHNAVHSTSLLSSQRRRSP